MEEDEKMIIRYKYVKRGVCLDMTFKGFEIFIDTTANELVYRCIHEFEQDKICKKQLPVKICNDIETGIHIVQLALSLNHSTIESRLKYNDYTIEETFQAELNDNGDEYGVSVRRIACDDMKTPSENSIIIFIDYLKSILINCNVELYCNKLIIDGVAVLI